MTAPPIPAATAQLFTVRSQRLIGLSTSITITWNRAVTSEYALTVIVPYIAYRSASQPFASAQRSSRN